MSENVRVDQGSVSHSSAGRGSAGEGNVKQGIAAGTSIGAAVVLTTVGILQLLQGIAAVAEDELFVVDRNTPSSSISPPGVGSTSSRVPS